MLVAGTVVVVDPGGVLVVPGGVVVVGAEVVVVVSFRFGGNSPSISHASPKFGQKKKSSLQHRSGGSGSTKNVNGIAGSV